MREVLRSKIHRAWVTDANPDYIGSILIDEDLMDRIDLWNFEKVLVCDVTNGNRFETYAIAGERGSGVISVQGAAARLSARGNCLIIMSFEVHRLARRSPDDSRGRRQPLRRIPGGGKACPAGSLS